MKTFGSLEDGALFDLGEKRFIKCLEMAGNGNAVCYDNPSQSILMPDYVIITPVIQVSETTMNQVQDLISQPASPTEDLRNLIGRNK